MICIFTGTQSIRKHYINTHFTLHHIMLEYSVATFNGSQCSRATTAMFITWTPEDT